MYLVVVSRKDKHPTRVGQKGIGVEEGVGLAKVKRNCLLLTRRRVTITAIG